MGAEPGTAGTISQLSVSSVTSPWLPEPRPRVKIGVHGALGLLVLVTLVTLTRELLGHVLLGVLHHLNTYTIISLWCGETI